MCPVIQKENSICVVQDDVRFDDRVFICFLYRFSDFLAIIYYNIIIVINSVKLVVAILNKFVIMF